MKTLNVQTDYGAAGDGSTDDTKAIQAAIDDASSGDTVYLPAGKYIVGKADAVDNEACLMFDPARGNGVSGVEFAGEGPDTEVKLSDGNGGFSKVIGVDTTSTITGLVIRDLVVLGNKDNQTSDARGKGISIDDQGANDNDITIRDVRVEQALDTGIGPTAGGITVEDCTVIESGKHGIGVGSPKSSDGVIVRRCLVERSAQDDDVTYNMDFGTGGGLVEDCVFLDSNGSGFKTTERTGDVTFQRIRCEGNRLMGFQQTGDGGTGLATFEDIICRNNGAPAFRLSGPFDYFVPSDAQIVGANSKVGIRGAGGHLEADGTVHLTGNTNNAIYNGGTTGYIEQLQTTGNVVSGDITIRSRDDQPGIDINGVPTADEVGAFTSTQTSGGAEIRTVDGLIQSSNGIVDTL